MKLGSLFTGGKDSVYAIDLARRQGHDTVCLLTMISDNDFSYMFHTAAIELTKLQAESLEMPILFEKTKGEKETELEDLERLIKRGIDEYKIEGIVTGALFSEYQASRIQKICDDLRIKCLNPNWHTPQEEHMRRVVKDGYKMIFPGVSAMGLDESWLNKIVNNEMIDRLVKMDKKVGFNVAGEGGEFETMVLDGPIFKKRVVIDDYEVKKDSADAYRMIVKKAHLE